MEVLQLSEELNEEPFEINLGRAALVATETAVNLEEDQKDLEFENNKQRDLAFQAIRSAYDHHPRVAQKHFEYRENTGPAIETFTGRDRLAEYLANLRRYRLLNRGEESKLFGEIEKGLAMYLELGGVKGADAAQQRNFIDFCAAYQALYHCNLRLVASIAMDRYWDLSRDEMMDVIQEGMYGLDKTITRFKRKLGFKFSTYGAYWIKERMDRAFAEDFRTIRLHKQDHKKWVSIEKRITTLVQQIGKEPRLSEIAAATGYSEAEVADLRTFGYRHLRSLNEQVGPEGSDDRPEITETIRDSEENIPQNLIILPNVVSNLFSEKGVLTEREKLVLGLHFGIAHHSLENPQIESHNHSALSIGSLLELAAKQGGLSQREMAPIIGVNHQRIGQIESEALGKLRKSRADLSLLLAA